MAHVHPWSSRRLNCYESQRTCSRQTSTPGSSVPPKTGASRSTTTAQYVPLTCCREATSVGAPVRRSGKELLKADRTRMICLEISHRRKPLDSTGGFVQSLAPHRRHVGHAGRAFLGREAPWHGDGLRLRQP